jgi:hypothetical protein
MESIKNRLRVFHSRILGTVSFDGEGGREEKCTGIA